jgi:hypothetical protein
MDDPRRLGKGRVRLVDAAPLGTGLNFWSRRQDSPVPLAVFAHCQYTRKRNLAARNAWKPFRVESSNPGGFRVRVNRSHPEGGRLLLCISTVRATLAEAINRLPPPKKTAERRTNRAFEPGRTRGRGRPRENLPLPAMLKTTPLVCE